MTSDGVTVSSLALPMLAGQLDDCYVRIGQVDDESNKYIEYPEAIDR